MSDFRLCYVNEPWAWFTTAPLERQWGDDWNDAPYEHNAGQPYAWIEGRGEPRYDIARVAYVGDLETPSSGVLNSQYSVQRINQGAVPWLVTAPWRDGAVVAIPAGTLLQDFIRLVELAGGTVFLPRGVTVP